MSKQPHIGYESIKDKPISELTREEMDVVIDHTLTGKREEETYVARDFFHKLNKNKGPRAVIFFTEQLNKAVSEGVIVPSDMEEFGKTETRMLNRAARKQIPRRDFFKTIAWGAGGVGTMMAGTGETGTLYREHRRKKGTLPREETPFDEFLWWLTITGVVIDTVTVGPALIVENADKWQEIKFQQASNAVAFLAREFKLRPDIEPSSKGPGVS